MQPTHRDPVFADTHTKKTPPLTRSDRYISTPPTTKSTSNNNGSQFHSLISNWEDMNAIRIEPNRTIATNQFDPKADFAPNELSLAIAQNTRQELMIIKPLS